MGHDLEESDRIDVECMRDSSEGSVPRFTWDYRIFARDGTTIIDTSDSGGVSYDSLAMARSEGLRMATESLHRLER